MNPAVHLMLSHKKIKRNYKEKSQTIEQFHAFFTFTIRRLDSQLPQKLS